MKQSLIPILYGLLIFSVCVGAIYLSRILNLTDGENASLVFGCFMLISFIIFSFVNTLKK